VKIIEEQSAKGASSEATADAVSDFIRALGKRETGKRERS
jgi:hypothetical protein